jgi:hypothetical protein
MSAVRKSRQELKDVDIPNWQSIDEQTALWMRACAAVRAPEDWVEFFKRPVLEPCVPAQIAEMLEVARGVMIYSWFFYPLATVGAEQSWRVLESAVRLRCQRIHVSTRRRRKNGSARDASFSENVDALLVKSVAAGLDKPRWDAVRRLRNSTSHPAKQMILDPGQAQSVLEVTVEALNELFR